MKKAAIYHFTDVSQQRPMVYKKQIEALKAFAESLGYEVTDVYCDMTLTKCDRAEYNRFKANIGLYDTLVVKDFYHITKNTGSCICALHELTEAGIEVVSIENGSFIWEDAPLDKPLRVATYACRDNDTRHSVYDNIDLSNDIFRYFIKNETNWTLIKQYSDKTATQNDGEQPALLELIQNKNQFDILLVNKLRQIQGKTSKFCKIREQLGLDIYSLEDGYLKYERRQKYV